MSSSKDPAFLFYTKDFQSGTLDLSCEEVGFYLRLLMYQHQHKYIPFDTEKIMRICGIFDIQKFDSIWESVKDKFVINGNQMVNQRLNHEMISREKYKPKKIASATLAGLISSSKMSYKHKEIIKKSFKINEFVNTNDEQTIKDSIHKWFNQMVNQMDNYLVNEDVNEDVIVNKDIITLDSYIEKRKIEFEKYSAEFKDRLKNEFNIHAPLVYTTDKADDQYKDFTEIINLAINDKDWISQLTRGSESHILKTKLTKFVNYCLKSQCFRTEKYLSHYQFQKHFVNKEKP